MMTCRPRRFAVLLPLLVLLALAAGCSGSAPEPTPRPAVTEDEGPPAPVTDEDRAQPAEEETEVTPAETKAIATFGAGCFWCVEAVLEQLDGVSDVRSGYMGGDVENPTYAAICSGTTGHAEVVQVEFDPAQIGYETLLEWFFRLHDPTTLNRQGADIGTQYRSVIFYHSGAQRVAAEKVMAAWDASGAYPDPIVTEIAEAATFYEAEAKHQDYYRTNPNAGYCRVVIRPKLEKLKLKK